MTFLHAKMMNTPIILVATGDMIQMETRFEILKDFVVHVNEINYLDLILKIIHELKNAIISILVKDQLQRIA